MLPLGGCCDDKFIHERVKRELARLRKTVPMAILMMIVLLVSISMQQSQCCWGTGHNPGATRRVFGKAARWALRLRVAEAWSLHTHCLRSQAKFLFVAIIDTFAFTVLSSGHYYSWRWKAMKEELVQKASHSTVINQFHLSLLYLSFLLRSQGREYQIQKDLRLW